MGLVRVRARERATSDDDDRYAVESETALEQCVKLAAAELPAGELTARLSAFNGVGWSAGDLWVW